MSFFLVSNILFAYLDIQTFLGILPPPYQIIYNPPYITGMYTSGPVYVTISGNGILPNTSGIFDNGTYTFTTYRGTGPFVTGAGFSSTNTRTRIDETKTIFWIDTIGPTFNGVAEGVTYTTPVTITFTDNMPGVSATLNGVALVSGTQITTNGTYQLIVTDTVGHTTGATFIIYITQGSGGSNNGNGGGGGGSQIIIQGSALGTRELTKGLCQFRNCSSSYYTDLCGPCTPKNQHFTLPYEFPAYHYTTPLTPSIHHSPYPKEWNDAYLRAYTLGITTIPHIKDAGMEEPLYRKFAAKMASEFAIKVIGLTPDETKTCDFVDIQKEIPELQYYMRLSCKLGIMGLNYYGDPDTVFNPNYIVTRDQFVTILSRILFGNEFNIKHGELTIYDKAKNFITHTVANIASALHIPFSKTTQLDRYTKHLNAIKKLGILTNYTLTIKEFRGYVMIIMYRLNKLGINNNNSKNLLQE